jgi:hypothetical protein
MRACGAGFLSLSASCSEKGPQIYIAGSVLVLGQLWGRKEHASPVQAGLGLHYFAGYISLDNFVDE